MIERRPGQPYYPETREEHDARMQRLEVTLINMLEKVVPHWLAACVLDDELSVYATLDPLSSRAHAQRWSSAIGGPILPGSGGGNTTGLILMRIQPTGAPATANSILTEGVAVMPLPPAWVLESFKRGNACEGAPNMPSPVTSFRFVWSLTFGRGVVPVEGRKSWGIVYDRTHPMDDGTPAVTP